MILGEKSQSFAGRPTTTPTLRTRPEASFTGSLADYSLLLTIRTATAPHTHDYRFGLSAEESAELRDNVGRMEDVCLGLTSRGPVTISVTLDKIA